MKAAFRSFPDVSTIHPEEKSSDGSSSYSQLSYTLQFWMLLIFGVPSLICSLYIIGHVFYDRAKWNALHNQLIIVIIVLNLIFILTDFSWMLDSLRHAGKVLSATPAFCLTWWFLDYSLYSAQTVILAWASIERHLLIFSNQLMSVKRKRILYHYLPPSLLLVYVFIFYAAVIFALPCQNKFDFHREECGSYPCFYQVRILIVWDAFFHSVVPTMIIAICNIALLYRIFVHKRRLQQSIQWRKYRHMAIQLLTISGVYLFLNFPLTVIMLVQLVASSEPQLGFGAQLYVFILTYSVILSLPCVVCLRSFSPDGRRQGQVSPMLTRTIHDRMFITRANVTTDGRAHRNATV